MTRLDKVEQASHTYDALYTESESVYTLPYRHSCYYPMFRYIARELRRSRASGVLEVGCGAGAFAHLMDDLDFCTYRGFDFSGEAVRKATSRTGKAAQFFVADATEKQAYTTDIEYDTIVCTEVLEHIPEDLQAVSRWPAGYRFIASVPNFDSRYHVRFFSDAAMVRARYGDLLDIQKVVVIKKPYLGNISIENYLRQLRWNRYRPRQLLKILGLASAEDLGCWFVFSGVIRS